MRSIEPGISRFRVRADARPGMTSYCCFAIGACRASEGIRPIGEFARKSPPAPRSKASGARNSRGRPQYAQEPAPGWDRAEAGSGRARWPIEADRPADDQDRIV